MTLFIQAASATALSLLAFSSLCSSTSPSSSAARILRSASWWTGKVLQSLSQDKLYSALGQNFSFCYNLPAPLAPAVLSFSAERGIDESGNACGGREQWLQAAVEQCEFSIIYTRLYFLITFSFHFNFSHIFSQFVMCFCHLY